MSNKGLAALLKDYNEYLSFGDTEVTPHYFPTGVLALNQIVADNGGRGIPGGSIIQLLAENKRGKSTLALDILAQAQKSSIKDIKVGDRLINAIVLDFERSYDPQYAMKIGVDNSKVLLVRTPYAEQSFNIAESLLLAGVQFLMVDSIAMVVPGSEEDKNYDDAQKVAAEAGAIGRFLKRINTIIDENVLVVLINQYRANMSQMSRSDKKAYGARLIQYVVKLTIELERIKNEEGRTTVQALVSKTKFGAEGRKVTFNIEFGKGIDYNGHIIDLALEFGIVEKGGAWYRYGEYKAQGTDNAKETFPMEEIKQQVIKYMEEK